MEDSEPIQMPRRSQGGGRPDEMPRHVAFERSELNQILRVYGRMVAAGQWRDYAISDSKETATFAVYRRTNEMPLFRIVKDPRLRRRQGEYAIIGLGGQILKRGHSLAQILKFFDKKRFEVVE